MNYLLMILSGVLGILGVVFETNKEVRTSRGKRKVITKWGITTVVALICILSISLIKQYIDDKRAERMDTENEFMELSGVSVGPQFYFQLNLKDSLFLTDATIRKKESLYAQQQEYSKQVNLMKGDSSNDQEILPLKYSGHYFDSTSRNALFSNKNFIDITGSYIRTLAYINFSAGILGGYISINSDGYTQHVFRVDSKDSSTIGAYHDSGLLFHKSQIAIMGDLEMKLQAGKVYGTVLKQIKNKKNLTNIKVYFDKEPNSNDLYKVNLSLNRIKNINLFLSYDIDAIRWLIVSMSPKNGYEFNRDMTEKRWVLTKEFTYDKLPYIGDISEFAVL